MQALSEITVHPLKLGEFGKTPAGLDLYRIVRANTRVSKLLYEGKLHEFRRYADYKDGAGKAIGSKWVLEKWLSPDKYVGMSRDDYERFMDGLGPDAPKEEYPSDGDYELAHVFQGAVNAEEARMGIEKTEYNLRNLSPDELKRVARAREEKKLEAKQELKEELLNEVLDLPTEKTGVIYG